ncbi:da50d51f-ff8f-459f-8231-5fd03a86e7c7 [Thermothielavioides terrestris]|uniref:Da50d51f-ff8f-459f-8231-5fd03a86e7c7 n=1 Tax=Thermothielavioides terrestris TaxID=2587410 RepID=A0A3S4AX64_9PEZI|nr:da50d51f-ff8f-459f-8231-5fd03a86e7c7 [Thermothielavioides terrestris]
MYSAPYGYPNPAAGPIFNGAPPQGAHLQPGPSPNQPQQIMYNAQQFPVPGQPGAFPAGPNPAMMGGGAGGPAGMMQNAAMPHMAANGHQMAFQQAPFTTSPYVAAVPSSAAPQPQLPANFMMAGQMPPYQMNSGMPGQQPMMQQRMLAAQQSAGAMPVSTPQRQFNPPQGTPTNSMPAQQQQFSTPQHQGTPQSQTPTTAQPPPASIATPQTPTFPTEQGQQLASGASATVSAPQSPSTESRDKERFAVLLEINQELLYESIQLVNSRNELKKEQAAAESAGTKSGEVDYAEEEKLANVDYNHPPSPAYLTPPPLNLQLTLRLPPSMPDDPIEQPADPVADRAERDQLLKSLYKKLQSLYPGVDPKKEPPVQPAGARPGTANSGAAAAGMKMPATHNGQASTPAAGQGSTQNSPAATPAPAQPQGTPQMANAAAPGLMQASS